MIRTNPEDNNSMNTDSGHGSGRENVAAPTGLRGLGQLPAPEDSEAVL